MVKKIISKIYNKKIHIPKEVWNHLELDNNGYIIWEINELNKVIIKKNVMEIKKNWRYIGKHDE